MITLKDWLQENEFNFEDIKNGDIKVYDENSFRISLYDLAETDDYEVLDSYTEEGTWVVIVEFLGR